MNNMTQAETDYGRIEQAIQYLEENFREQPNLDDVAAQVHLSPFHFQRLFKEWAGVTPKQFLKFLTLEHAQKLLSESESVLETTYEVGLSSPSRLHDLFVSIDAVTPAEYKRMGEGLEIIYGYHSTPFGECLLGVTERGITGLFFVQGDRAAALADFQKTWPEATFVEDPTVTAPTAAQIFPSGFEDAPREVKLFLKGTNFQVKVWEALLRIPPAAVCSYGDIARLLGNPNASRAVGTAVGSNFVAYLIPCHRVIRSSGVIRDYRWGSARKKAILGWEAARAAVVS